MPSVSAMNHPGSRRWRRFLKHRIAVVSSVVLVLFMMASLMAELIANDRPLIMKYGGKIYFPVFRSPTVLELGVSDSYAVDYRRIAQEIQVTRGNQDNQGRVGAGDWVIFTPIRFNPYQSNTDVVSYPSPPTRVNPLGTDDRGRDVLARLLYGFRISFAYALGTWIVTYLVGVSLGLGMGFFGGRTDFVGQRLVEVMSCVPQFFLLITLISIFEPNVALLVVITSVFGWIPISYYARAEGLRLRKMEFVDAARAIGLPTWRVLFRHVLPNALTPVLTFSPFAIAAGITGLAALDYLGFGLQPPIPSWGELLNQAKKYFTSAWWLALYPSLALFGTLACLSFVGEGLRNAFDPKN